MGSLRSLRHNPTPRRKEKQYMPLPWAYTLSRRLKRSFKYSDISVFIDDHYAYYGTPGIISILGNVEDEVKLKELIELTLNQFYADKKKTKTYPGLEVVVACLTRTTTSITFILSNGDL
jgi:hypothetical protein